jgi:hypothetical protein
VPVLLGGHRSDYGITVRMGLILCGWSGGMKPLGMGGFGLVVKIDGEIQLQVTILE